MADFEKLINASDLIEWIMETYPDWCVGSVRSIVDHVDALPSAQPERIRAKWIVTTSLQEGQITWKDYKCSNCSHHREKPMNFCEVCGAKMERTEKMEA